MAAHVDVAARLPEPRQALARHGIGPVERAARDGDAARAEHRLHPGQALAPVALVSGRASRRACPSNRTSPRGSCGRRPRGRRLSASRRLHRSVVALVVLVVVVVAVAVEVDVVEQDAEDLAPSPPGSARRRGGSRRGRRLPTRTIRITPSHCAASATPSDTAITGGLSHTTRSKAASGAARAARASACEPDQLGGIRRQRPARHQRTGWGRASGARRPPASSPPAARS